MVDAVLAVIKWMLPSWTAATKFIKLTLESSRTEKRTNDDHRQTFSTQRAQDDFNQLDLLALEVV